MSGAFATFEASKVFSNASEQAEAAQRHPQADSIQHVVLEDTVGLSNRAIESLAHFTNLRSLVMWPSASEATLCALEGLPNIETLDLSHCIELTDAALTCIVRK